MAPTAHARHGLRIGLVFIRGVMWYGCGMHPRFLLSLGIFVMSCGDEEREPQPEAPAICQPDQEVIGLELFSPCTDHSQCSYGVACLNGFCTEPCREDDDCIEFGYPGSTFCKQVDEQLAGCVYFCHGYALEGYCPIFEDTPMKCEEQAGAAPTGEAEYTCISAISCDGYAPAS